MKLTTSTSSNFSLLTLAIFATVLLLQPSPLFAKFHDRKIFVSKFGSQTKSLADLQHVRAAVRSSALASLSDIPQSVKAELVAHAEAEMKQGRGYVNPSGTSPVSSPTSAAATS